MGRAVRLRNNGESSKNAEQFGIRLQHEYRQGLDRECGRTGKSKSKIIHEALDLYFKNDKTN